MFGQEKPPYVPPCQRPIIECQAPPKSRCLQPDFGRPVCPCKALTEAHRRNCTIPDGVPRSAAPPLGIPAAPSTIIDHGHTPAGPLQGTMRPKTGKQLRPAGNRLCSNDLLCCSKPGLANVAQQQESPSPIPSPWAPTSQNLVRPLHLTASFPLHIRPQARLADYPARTSSEHHGPVLQATRQRKKPWCDRGPGINPAIELVPPRCPMASHRGARPQHNAPQLRMPGPKNQHITTACSPAPHRADTQETTQICQPVS